jgi:hypothetical protein
MVRVTFCPDAAADGAALEVPGAGAELDPVGLDPPLLLDEQAAARSADATIAAVPRRLARGR